MCRTRRNKSEKGSETGNGKLNGNVFTFVTTMTRTRYYADHELRAFQSIVTISVSPRRTAWSSATSI